MTKEKNLNRVAEVQLFFNTKTKCDLRKAFA